MENEKRFENYPARLVLLANLFSYATPVLGALVILGFGWPWMLLYLGFIAALEIRVLSVSCRGCYYYGKTCFSGKGRVAAMLFDKGLPGSLAAREITWISILPDFMVSLVPIIAGIILMIQHFDWLILGAVVTLSLLASVGNGYIRGTVACKYCKQRDLGCPAERLFKGKASTDQQGK